MPRASSSPASSRRPRTPTGDVRTRGAFMRKVAPISGASLRPTFCRYFGTRHTASRLGQAVPIMCRRSRRNRGNDRANRPRAPHATFPFCARGGDTHCPGASGADVGHGAPSLSGVPLHPVVGTRAALGQTTVSRSRRPSMRLPGRPSRASAQAASGPASITRAARPGAGPRRVPWHGGTSRRPTHPCARTSSTYRSRTPGGSVAGADPTAAAYSALERGVPAGHVADTPLVMPADRRRA